MDETGELREEIGKGRALGFDGLLLIGVIALILTGCVLGTALYLLPEEHLVIPELQPAIRLTRATELPVGASRVTNWGDRVVLVVHRDSSEYFALQGTSPLDGCILYWDSESLRVMSPCGYVVYDTHGNVVEGLTTEPLQRYSVDVREGIIYVTGR